jgi:hypothetical protein
MSLFVFHIVLLYIKSLSLLMSEVHEFFFSFCQSATFCVFFFFILVPISMLCGLVFDANFRKFPVFLLLHFYELSSSLITRYPVMPRYLVVIVLTL